MDTTSSACTLDITKWTLWKHQRSTLLTWSRATVLSILIFFSVFVLDVTVQASPAISGVSASVASSGATITWTTDEPSTSQVNYGTATPYTFASPLDASLVTTHSVSLSNLIPSTTYHYQIASQDSSGNLSTLADFTFITSAAQSGIPLSNGTWTMVLTQGIPEQSNDWEQLVYASAVKESIMLSQYHQFESEPNETLLGYSFDTNSWTILDMGGLFHTENMPEGGESVGYLNYNANNNTLIYHCCVSGSNQAEEVNHTWWYDLLGQSGRDKQTSPEPPFMALQPGGAFDVAHDIVVIEGGASFVGTWTYDPVANVWSHMNPGGTPPDPSLILPSMAYSSTAQQVYLFGGLNGTFNSNLYSYNAATNTWTLISPANGVTPPGRYRANLAYDSTNNILLLYGGQNGSGVLGDTWVYDPVANTWTQLTPPQSPPLASAADFVRLAYDSDHNVFVLAHRGSGGYFGGIWNNLSIQTWLFRYKGSGPNPGTLSNGAQPAAGGVNRNLASWAKDPAIAAFATSIYTAWTETGSPFDSTGGTWPHIYANQYSGGGWATLGSSAMAISTGTFNIEAHLPSITVSAGQPWISWYQSIIAGGDQTEVFAGSWNGSSWRVSGVGLVSGSSATQGQSQITDVGGEPYLAFIEVNKSTAPQSAWVYLKAWNGTSWILQNPTPLNRNSSPGSTASSVSIASDGASPYIAWTEYLRSTSSQGGDAASPPQVYVSHWNGTQWAAVGGSLNINSSNWAYDPSIAYVAGQPYVAWVERSKTGNALLYVATWNGTMWVLVGSSTLNINTVTGWAFHPALVADSSTNNLYVAWIEQAALGQKAQVFVLKYSSGTWIPLGGALNVDTAQGSAQRVSLALSNGSPVTAWGEVNFGSMRNIYVKQWNGSNWIQLPGSMSTDTTAPTVPTNLSVTPVSVNQVNLSWAGSNDSIGVVGYLVYRGGSQIGNVTATHIFQDTTLSPYTAYSYSIAAYDAAGNISAESAAVTGMTLAATPVGISTVTLSPSSVTGGLSTTSNKVVLNGPAPSGGAVIRLSASDASVSLPPSVTVAAGGSTSTPFSISTSSVSSNLTVTISATYNGITDSANLTVTPSTVTGLSSITLTPNSVVGGRSTNTNYVTLSGPAPSGGAVINLASSDPSTTVPSSVTVTAGATVSPNFTISTTPVTTNTIVTISATYNDVTTSATLTVTPTASGSLSTVLLSPTSVVGGLSTKANSVKLTGPAPSGGAVVSLASSDPSTTVPSSVTVAAGATISPYFMITTSSVTASTSVTISATYNGVSKTGALTVTPAALSSVTLSPTSAAGGTSTTANHVSLNGPAPAAGAVVSLASSDPSTTLPSSVTVAAGATVSPNFTITTTSVTANTTVTISATYNGVNKSGTLTVIPSTLSAVLLSPTSVVGGLSTKSNSVKLSGPAPSGGEVVSLASSDPSTTVPSSVTVAAGATISPYFTITTTSVSANTSVTISATYNGVTKTATLTVTPGALSSVTLSPTSVTGGASTTANHVSLNGPAPAGGAVVSLATSDPSTTLPPSVAVTAGATVSPNFTISTTSVTANISVTISGTYNSLTKTATLTVTP